MMRASRATLATTALAVVTLLQRVSEACPDCPVGRQARASVFDADFPRYLAMMLLPFGVIGLVALCAYRGARLPRLPFGSSAETARG